MPREILLPDYSSWNQSLTSLHWTGKGSSFKTPLPLIYQEVSALAQAGLDTKVNLGLDGMEPSAILLASLYRKDATGIRGAAALAVGMSREDSEETRNLGVDIARGLCFLQEEMRISDKNARVIRNNAEYTDAVRIRSTRSSDLVRKWINTDPKTAFLEWAKMITRQVENEVGELVESEEDLAKAQEINPFELFKRLPNLDQRPWGLYRIVEASGDSSKIEVRYDRFGRREYFDVNIIGVDGNNSSILNMAFNVGEDRVLKDFNPKRDGESVMSVFVRKGGVGSGTPYYPVRYVLEEGGSTAIIDETVVLMDESTKPNTKYERVAEFTRQTDGGLLFKRMIEETGLPERIDLLKTLMMYIGEEFEQDGQMVPVTVETLKRQVVIPA